MLTFSLPIFTLLLLFTTTTTTAQPYNATDIFFINCGTPSTTTTDRRWDGDENSKFIPSNIVTTSFSSQPESLDSSVPQIPFSSARIINGSSITYTFPVSKGPKFLRLHFYPATYNGHRPEQSFFSVSSNGFSLLNNFSAFLAASFLAKTRSNGQLDEPPVPYVVKEYIIYVEDEQILNVTFTPSPNSYAFINGIEIVSMPEDLYFNSKNMRPVELTTAPAVTSSTALENFYRLNMGGSQLPGAEDTGMYRIWDQDVTYIYGAQIGLQPVYNKSIMYTAETPDYTAPEQVYKTQRSMGPLANLYNLTWILSVDSGFYYMLRFHFCNIIPQYTKSGQVVFKIFINNKTADEEIDLFHLTKGSGYPVYNDYVVFHGPDSSSRGKKNLWVAMHSSPLHELYEDAFLNGLEVFKLSMDGSLASPNPELSFTTPPTGQTATRNKNKEKLPYAMIIGTICGALVLLSILVLIVCKLRRRDKHGAADDRSSYGPAYSESKSTKSSHSTLPSDRCRRFSFTEVKEATNEFNDEFVIGNGGFGKVYKGYIDNATTAVAIKRLNESSSQGFQEFRTEIGMLSKLRHVQLVSLIGYCEDEGEMILVYDYMAHGTLREHLYKTNNPPLSWKRRLHICIGAAKGLHYLHTGAKRAIIHRDVKSTNILLDENWVAKVSDFGLSKLGPRDQAQNHVSTVVKGSIGYVDPEYYRRQQLTEKSDVYSFGVVLLEVLCARPVMIPGLPKEQASLAEWGKSCFRKGCLNKIIDPKLKSLIAPESLKQFGVVAVSCLKEQGSERPAMDEVVWGLEFALELQEAAEKAVEVVPDNQDHPLLIQGEATPSSSSTTTTDNDVFTGSSAIRNGTSSISSSADGFKSETVFSEILKPTGR
ncbi:hypothetical protein R6Q57_001235 [Mikania cordata]